MRQVDSDLRLYDAGTHVLINSISDCLVSYRDADALKHLVGFLAIELNQPSSLGIPMSMETLQHFVLHAQRARTPAGLPVLDVEFLNESFEPQVRQQVPGNPPIAPDGLWLTDAGGGTLTASSSLGASADTYYLQQRISGQWTSVARGVAREDGVDYQVTGLAPGMHEFRVVPRLGFFVGLPGSEESITMGA